MKRKMSDWEKKVTATDKKLKPCPFCGKKVKIEYYEVNEPVTFADCGFEIRCWHCGIRFSKHLRCMPGFDEKTETEAKDYLVDKWNTRYNA